MKKLSLLLCAAAFALLAGCTAKNVPVETEYFTLALPLSWQEDCAVEIRQTEAPAYSVDFCLRRAADAGFGGRLFSILLLPPDEDYTQFPSVEALGSLEIADAGTYNLIVMYPTDVQFDEPSMARYHEMTAEIPQVLATLAYRDGVTFSAEPVAVTPHYVGDFIGSWRGTAVGSPAPDGASRWDVEFRHDATGAFRYTFEAGDAVTAEFTYSTFEIDLGRNYAGILIPVEGGADRRLILSFSWSDALQTTLMTMHPVEPGGAMSETLAWVFALEHD